MLNGKVTSLSSVNIFRIMRVILERFELIGVIFERTEDVRRSIFEEELYQIESLE